MSKISNTMNALGKVVVAGTISFVASNAMAQASDINWMASISKTKKEIAAAEAILKTYNPQSTTYQKAARDLPVLQNTLSWENAEADKKARSRGYVPNSAVKRSGYNHQAELYRLGVREGVPSPYSAVPPYPPGTKPVERTLWDTSSKGYQEYGRHVIDASSAGPNSSVESFRPAYRPPVPPETYEGTTGYTKLLGQMRNQITSFPDELINHILPGQLTAKDGSNKVLTTSNEKMLYIREQLFDLYQRLEQAKNDETKKSIVASFEKTTGVSETRLTAAFAARDAMFERAKARQDYRDSLMSPEEQTRHREKVEAMQKKNFLEGRNYDDQVRIALNKKVDAKFPELSAGEFLKSVTTETGKTKAGALKAWIERAGGAKLPKVSSSMGILGLALAATASSAANAGEAESATVAADDAKPATFSRKEFRTHRTSN